MEIYQIMDQYQTRPCKKTEWEENFNLNISCLHILLDWQKKKLVNVHKCVGTKRNKLYIK